MATLLALIIKEPLLVNLIDTGQLYLMTVLPSFHSERCHIFFLTFPWAKVAPLPGATLAQLSFRGFSTLTTGGGSKLG